MEVVATTGLLELQDVQSSSQIIATNKPTSCFFTGRMPFLSPNQVSKHWRGENGLAYPKLTWSLPTLSLTTNSSWLPWESVAMPLISSLMPVPPSDASTPTYTMGYTAHFLVISRVFLGYFEAKFLWSNAIPDANQQVLLAGSPSFSLISFSFIH